MRRMGAATSSSDWSIFAERQDLLRSPEAMELVRSTNCVALK